MQRFLLAYQLGDASGTEAELAWASGTAAEADMRERAATAAAFEGRLKLARLLRDAAEHARGAERGAWKASTRARGVLIDAAVGAKVVGRIENRPGVVATTPIVAAVLSREYAQATAWVAACRCPTEPSINPLEVLIAIARGEPGAVGRLGGPAPGQLTRGYQPVYLRGLAYLAAGDGKRAIWEFQRIIDRRGLAPVSVLYPLAHVQQARAYRLNGERQAARAAYERFFELWKGADADVPVLVEARREYAALR